jgi:hypothetical protein
MRSSVMSQATMTCASVSSSTVAKWLCREGNIHPAALRNLEALMITGTPEGS